MPAAQSDIAYWKLPVPDQELLVYQAICAIAAHCDGAIDKDGVGFNGQDTLFGRRIASEPFESWTPEIRVEAARILRKYVRQTEEYLGIDPIRLIPVKKAEDRTNRIGRTADEIFAWYLLGNETVDDFVFALIESKRQVFKAAADGQIDDAAAEEAITEAVLGFYRSKGEQR